VERGNRIKKEERKEERKKEMARGGDLANTHQKSGVPICEANDTR